MKVASVEVTTKQLALPGARITSLTPTKLVVDGATYKLTAPTKNGKPVEILAAAIATDGDAIWAILSDTFAVAQGRFVARLTWTKKTAVWGPLKSPYSWSPYSHSGMTLERIGAATVDTAWITAASETTCVLARVGKQADKGVEIPRGMVAIGSEPAFLLVFANRKFRFLDATGAEVAGFGFSGDVKKAIGTPSNIAWLGASGREILVRLHDQRRVRIRLDEDPPALVIPGRQGRAPKPAFVETTGTYGALDPARSRSPMVLAIERVQAWDLNETPVFGKPAPFGALNLQKDALSFCRERDGRLKKSFDFMARAITVSIAKAPKGTPMGIVLAQLRTPSGLTQVLCREEFAKLLAANTKRPK